jgi:threonine dehydratase
MDPALDLSGKNIVLALTGGNIDLTLVSRVIDRGLAADGRLCRARARLLDRPGALAALTAVLASTGASVKEIIHDRHFGPADIARVFVTATLETRDKPHIDQIRQALASSGIDATIE